MSSVLFARGRVAAALICTTALGLFVATTPAAATTPALPLPPKDYALPAGAQVVSTGQQLVSALAKTTPSDIVLADGDYTTAGTTADSGYFRASAGHRLWAAHRGRAVMRAGLMFGGLFGSSGGEVHGLTFDIADRERSFSGVALYNWGPRGAGTKVLDSVFLGHYALDEAIDFREVADTVIQRVIVRQFRRQGVRVSDCCDDNWYDNPARALSITDVDVDGVREIVPGSTDGKAEYGIWLGNGVVGPVERLRIEHAWWSGLWTGASSSATIFRDLTIGTVGRERGNAVYNEHRTSGNTFERFMLGPDVAEGFVCEWNYGQGAGACTNNVFQDGTIDSTRVGVFLDEGQVGNAVRNVRFLNQSCAAIVDSRGTGNVFTGNDFSGLPAGVSQVRSYC